MKILFYNDAPDFGGHEVMSLEAVKYLLLNNEIEITYMFYEGNERLDQHLTRIRDCSRHIYLLPIEYRSRPAQGIFTLFSPLVASRVKKQIEIINPEIVVVIQGSIEVSSLGLISSSSSGYKTISYIPNAYKLSSVGLKFGYLRDTINRYLFTKPNGYITVSKYMKDLLEQRGVKKRIIVVNNGIDVERCIISGNGSTRSEVGIREDDFVVGIIGRIYFKSKGHDLLITAMARHINKLQGITLLIVGEGPDEDRLRQMVISRGLESYVRFHPWCDDISSIYSIVDMVIIPSNNEGFPLVMLEAMCHELPVIASNIRGISEILPTDWLFNNSDPRSIIHTLLRVKNADNTKLINENREKVFEKYNLNEFGKNFKAALYEL